MPKYQEAIESMRPDAAKMLEQLYGPFVKQLNLPPEQSEKFYEILLENKMNGLAQRADLQRHENITRLSEQVAHAQKEMVAGLRVLLGEANFARFVKYQAGIGDRSRLEMMKHFFTRSPLTDDQQQLLLEAMEAGRKALDDGGSTEFSMADNSGVMDQKLARQESINQFVLERAAAFLSPEQSEILASTQAKMLAQIREGYVKMREMFNASGKPNP